jgi:hypothetical protein
LLLALIAFTSTFRRGPDVLKFRSVIRFIAYSAAGHFLIYSLIAYKTPWLACLPWAHVCLLAGFAVAGFFTHHVVVRYALIFLTFACLFTQYRQSRYATGRFASDERNPFAYVPTRKDIESAGEWLEKLRACAAPGELEEVAVIGRDYWPLPWYLRGFEKIGYWKEVSPDPAKFPVDLAKFPVVLAMPEAAEAVGGMLDNTHVSRQRGLRAGVPIQLFVRNDIWKRWMKPDSP